MEFSKKSERQSKQLKTSGNKGRGLSLEDNREIYSRISPLQLMPMVIQRISEEDMNQAIINIRGSVERHGYTAEGVESMIRHRYDEINVGNQQHLLIGLGADEGNSAQGSIIYDCVLDHQGIYHIDAFHAHGGQTEGGSRGY